MNRDERGTPPGWEFNPSSASHRAPLLTAIAVGLAAAIACIMHVHGWIASIWEPFPRIVDGWVLEPEPAVRPEIDGVLFAVMLLLAAAGPSDRWRARPSLPIAGAVLALVEATSAVARWAVAYASTGTVSTLFTVIAGCAVASLPLCADEAFAALVRERSVRRTIYRGPSGLGGERVGHLVRDWSGYASGTGAILVGLWLLVAPLPDGVAGHARLIGSFVVTLGALALAQVTRLARWGNAALGAWLMVAPLLRGFALRGTVHFLSAGLILLMLSMLAEPVDRDDRSHARHA